MTVDRQGVAFVSAEIPHGSVVITPAEQFAEMREIGRKLDHLAAVVDPALQQVRTDVTANAAKIETIKAERVADVEKLETRIRVLENWRWLVIGAATVLGTIGGWLVSTLTNGG